jgi:integrase
VIERFAADLERLGTGRATIVSTLSVLQGVMKRAVRDYNLSGNPVKQIDKPSQRREREPILITVEQVEAMRLACLRRDDLRSATLISLLAYAGPRPESEALPLTWAAIRRRTILIRATKRGVAHERATRLLGPLADDLRAWREACGRPHDNAPVIPNARGDHWSRNDWDNWRVRSFRSAAAATGLPAGKDDGASRVRPRDLRSSFATLLIYEGQPPPYVAEQLGHSAATLLRDYARVWGDFDPSQRISAETQIALVRGRIEGAETANERHRPTPELFRDAPRTGRAFPNSATSPRRRSRKARASAHPTAVCRAEPTLRCNFWTRLGRANRARSARSVDVCAGCRTRGWVPTIVAMASYVFCRVCDERHDSYEKALRYLTGLVTDERYYTRHETPPKIMRRTPMIGVGAHGGRGLFVMGACAGLRWQPLGPEDLPYLQPDRGDLGRRDLRRRLRPHVRRGDEVQPALVDVGDPRRLQAGAAADPRRRGRAPRARPADNAVGGRRQAGRPAAVGRRRGPRRRS